MNETEDCHESKLKNASDSCADRKDQLSRFGKGRMNRASTNRNFTNNSYALYGRIFLWQVLFILLLPVNRVWLQSGGASGRNR